MLSNPSSGETLVGLTVPAGAEAVTLSPNPLPIPAGAERGAVTVTGVAKAGYTSHRAVTLRGRVTSPVSTVSRDGSLTVLDADPPVVAGETAPTVREEETPVGSYTAANPANIGLVWGVAGADAAAFRIDARGRLRFAAVPDFEAQASYRVTVTATDRSQPAALLTGELAVTVAVTDAPGRVALSPASPQVGRELTATLRDPDGVGTVTEWCWARSPLQTFQQDVEDLGCSTNELTAAATYTPVGADLNHHVRATVSYTDGAGTAKTVAGVTERQVTRHRTPRRPTGPGGPGPGGGGGGGGSACAEDVHGNSAAQATALALATETTGALCPAADVDYFTVTAPGRGLLFVDTFGGLPTRGTLWQDDAVLASGPAGRLPDARLGARVRAGPVIIALQGQGGGTGPYAIEVTFVRGR